MKLQLKCDTCGKIGTTEEISTCDDGRDLCETCKESEELEDLRQEYKTKKEWLESTHLKDLRELEEKIKRLEILVRLEGGEPIQNK